MKTLKQLQFKLYY